MKLYLYQSRLVALFFSELEIPRAVLGTLSPVCVDRSVGMYDSSGYHTDFILRRYFCVNG